MVKMLVASFLLLPVLIILAACTVSQRDTTSATRDSQAVTPKLQSAGSEVIALLGGTVIDGTGSAPRENSTVLIRGERIAAVGSNVAVPEGARVIHIKGKTVLPGLIDMHGHLYARFGGSVQNVFGAYPALYLAGGVTTVRSPGDFDPQGMYDLKRRVATGEVVGPRIFMGGPYLQGKDGGHEWMQHAQTIEEITRILEQWKDRIDVVKFYNNVSEEQMEAGMKAARSAGLPTAAHLRSITAARAVDLGIGSLEHGIHGVSELYAHLPASARRRLCDADLESPVAKALVDMIVRRGVAIDPTLGVILLTEAKPDSAPEVPDWKEYFADPAVANEVEREMVAFSKRWSGESNECALRGREMALQFVKAVHDRGGVVIAGTDPFFPNPHLLPGWGFHAELKYLTQAGLTPLEAVKAATFDAASVLGRQSELGSIAAGKLADLIVVDGNPALRIDDIGKTEIVFKAGKEFSPKVLRESAKRKIVVRATVADEAALKAMRTFFEAHNVADADSVTAGHGVDE